MKVPDDVSAMLRLKELGWGTRSNAAELGCSRTTVRRWLREGGWRRASTPERASVLAGHEAWLSERFRRHGGNADVVRQELAAEKGVTVSLRTVERAEALAMGPGAAGPHRGSVARPGVSRAAPPS